MKLVWWDCRFGKIVSDESVKHYPQCGSENIHISLNGEADEQKTQPRLSKEERQPGKKIAKVGSYIIIMALLTLAINFIMPTSTSYAFILFLFPIELVIGLVLLVVGFLVSQTSGSFQARKGLQYTCQKCGNILSPGFTRCLKCGEDNPIE